MASVSCLSRLTRLLGRSPESELVRLGREHAAAQAEYFRLNDDMVQLRYIEGRPYNDEAHDAAQARWSELNRRINEAHAQTPAELAVKAVLAAGVYSDVMDVPESERDWEQALIADLIEQVCAAAGVDRFGDPLR